MATLEQIEAMKRQGFFVEDMSMYGAEWDGYWRWINLFTTDFQDDEPCTSEQSAWDDCEYKLSIQKAERRIALVHQRKIASIGR